MLGAIFSSENKVGALACLVGLDSRSGDEAMENTDVRASSSHEMFVSRSGKGSSPLLGGFVDLGISGGSMMVLDRGDTEYKENQMDEGGER